MEQGQLSSRKNDEFVGSFTPTGPNYLSERAVHVGCILPPSSASPCAWNALSLCLFTLDKHLVLQNLAQPLEPSGHLSWVPPLKELTSLLWPWTYILLLQSHAS